MRAIVFVWGRANREADWNSREVKLEKSGATIEDVLKTAKLKDRRTLFDLIGAGNGVKNGYVIYWNGKPLKGVVDIKVLIKNGDFFHIMDS